MGGMRWSLRSGRRAELKEGAKGETSVHLFIAMGGRTLGAAHDKSVLLPLAQEISDCARPSQLATRPYLPSSRPNTTGMKSQIGYSTRNLKRSFSPYSIVSETSVV